MTPERKSAVKWSGRPFEVAVDAVDQDTPLSENNPHERLTNNLHTPGKKSRLLVEFIQVIHCAATMVPRRECVTERVPVVDVLDDDASF